MFRRTTIDGAHIVYTLLAKKYALTNNNDNYVY